MAVIPEARGSVCCSLAIAKGCPHLDRDGGVEVGELADLQPDARLTAG